MRALATYYMNRTDFAKCAEIGEELLRIGDTEQDESIRLVGHYQYGIGKAFSGDLEVGLTHLETAIELFDPRLHSSGRLSLGPNTGLAARNTYGMLLCQKGEMDQGVAQVRAALDLARDIDHPYSVAYALYHNGFLALIRERFAECAELARMLAPLAEEHGYTVWGILSQVLLGVSTAALGAGDEGLALTEKAIELYQGLTTPPVFWPEILQLRATVNALAGRPDTALELIDEAIRLENVTPGAYVARGDFFMMLSKPEKASREYQVAAQMAGDMGLRLFGLIALTRLVNLNGATDHRRDLEKLYLSFSEGFDENPLLQAREALGI
jgi:tetratricopeptide (TPR) repeat protein